MFLPSLMMVCILSDVFLVGWLFHFHFRNILIIIL